MPMRHAWTRCSRACSPMPSSTARLTRRSTKRRATRRHATARTGWGPPCWVRLVPRAESASCMSPRITSFRGGVPYPSRGWKGMTLRRGPSTAKPNWQGSARCSKAGRMSRFYGRPGCTASTGAIFRGRCSNSRGRIRRIRRVLLPTSGGVPRGRFSWLNSYVPC